MYSIEEAIRRLELLKGTGVDYQPQARPVPAAGAPHQLASPVDSVGLAPAPGKHTPVSVEPVGEASYFTGVAEPADMPQRRVDVVLDMQALSRRGFLMPDTQRDEVAEQFRVVKRPLLTGMEQGLARGSRRANLIAVTSAMPAEGKTFCSINLAMSMVLEVEKKVLLVDADLVRPSLHRVFGIDASARGLLDVLEKQCTVPESILNTSIPKLSIMPAGKPRSNSTELLASTTMRRLAEELALRYPDRIVIFDTSPVLATTQAQVLASIVGQVLLVTAAVKSTRKQLHRALEVLEGIKHVSVVLNQSRGKLTDFCFDAY